MRIFIDHRFFIMINIFIMLISSSMEIIAMKQIDHSKIVKIKVDERDLGGYSYEGVLVQPGHYLKIDSGRGIKTIIPVDSLKTNKDLNLFIIINKKNKGLEASIHKEAKCDVIYKFKKKSDKKRTIAIKKARAKKFNE